MKRTKQLSLSLIAVGLCGILSMGCGGSSSSGGGTTTGIVGQLTGDPDDQVSSSTQQLVSDALARGDTDEPLDF